MVKTTLRRIILIFASVIFAAIICNLFTLGAIILDSLTYQPTTARLSNEESDASQICILTDAPNIFLLLDILSVKFVIDNKASLPNQITIERGLRSDPAFGPFIGTDFQYDKVCVNDIELEIGVHQIKYLALRNYLNYTIETFRISISKDGSLLLVK